MKKERLDKYLTDLGYFETKSKAAAAILAGTVKVNDEVITKAGFQIDITKEYDFCVKTMPYVSRGGFKLQKACLLGDSGSGDGQPGGGGVLSHQPGGERTHRYGWATAVGFE